jgi:hypothetical protein
MVVELGLNDLNQLRDSLSKIEDLKLQIDEEIQILEDEVSELAGIRHERLPDMNKLDTELSQYLVQIEGEISSKRLQVKEEYRLLKHYADSNNVGPIRVEISSRRVEVGDLRTKISISKDDRDGFAFLFGLFFLILFSYFTFGYLWEHKDRLTYMCPDDITEVGYYDLMDGKNDCPGGWDESDSWLDAEDGYSTKSNADGGIALGWIIAIVLVIVCSGLAGWSLAVGYVFLFSIPKRRKASKLEAEIDSISNENRVVLSNFDEIQYRINSCESTLSSLETTKKFKKKKLDQIHGRAKKPAFTFSSDKGWVCSICKKRFGSLNAVQSHMKDKNHSGEPYELTSIADEDISGELKADDCIPLLEERVVELDDSIRQRVSGMRSNSEILRNSFNLIKHLIPNSDSISPESSDLEEILERILARLKEPSDIQNNEDSKDENLQEEYSNKTPLSTTGFSGMLGDIL